MKKLLFLTGLFLMVLIGCGKVSAVTEPAATNSAGVVPTGTITETQTDVRKEANSDQVILIERAGRFNGINSIRKAVEVATDQGVEANTIVLLLLLPLVATLVSVLHYVFGLSGYGIFIPTMISVAFLATGILGGLVLFAMIMAISLLSNLGLRRFKLHFWPSRSINLMLISLGTFGLMVISKFVPIMDLSNISIFPILFMILLVEEFVRTQLAKSRSEAKKLMTGTLILAVFGAWMMNFRSVQMFVLRYPELCLIVGLVVNFVVGNYTGIRFSEIKRFKKAIRFKNDKRYKSNDKR